MLGSSSVRVVKWKEIGCNLKKLESNDEPGLVGLMPRSRFCCQADVPSCRERRWKYLFLRRIIKFLELDSCGTELSKYRLPRVLLDYFQIFFFKPQGWAVDQVITRVLKVSVGTLCVKWSWIGGKIGHNTKTPLTLHLPAGIGWLGFHVALVEVTHHQRLGFCECCETWEPKIHLPPNILDHTGIGSQLEWSTAGEQLVSRGTAACPNTGSSLVVQKDKD